MIIKPFIISLILLSAHQIIAQEEVQIIKPVLQDKTVKSLVKNKQFRLQILPIQKQMLIFFKG